MAAIQRHYRQCHFFSTAADQLEPGTKLFDASQMAGFPMLFDGSRISGAFWDPILLGCQEPASSHMSQTLHVWYIYLHWGGLGGQCRHIWHTWSVWVSHACLKNIHQVKDHPTLASLAQVFGRGTKKDVLRFPGEVLDKNVAWKCCITSESRRSSAKGILVHDILPGK